MLDGIRLSKDQLAIMALGITSDGCKHVLDFDRGQTAPEIEAAKQRRLVRKASVVITFRATTRTSTPQAQLIN